MKIYLINPKPDSPCIFGEEYLGGDIIFISDNTLPTVAACIPKDIQVEICEERVSKINYDTDADWIGLTGRIAQQNNLVQIAQRFREKGKKVVIGGSFAARFSEKILPYCDVLVSGEIEEIATDLFNDLKTNNYKREYVGTKPNPLISPIPRWDLYPTNKALIGTIQITRGCPFGCDFCDIIQFNGRIARCKSIDKVIDELNVLYFDCKFKIIFISDDNVIGNIPYAERLFRAIADWRKDKNVSFIVQTPVLLAQNERLLHLAAEAGIKHAYIGVESFDDNLLDSIHKSHNNTKITPYQTVDKFLNLGIVPMVGFIIGFDQHTEDIFESTYQSCMKLASPIIYLQALTAYPHTPFFDKFQKLNRLGCHVEQLTGYPWHTNIIPKNMNVNDMGRGIHKLLNRLYEPEAFKTRLLHALSKVKPFDAEVSIQSTEITYEIFKRIVKISKADRELCKYIIRHHKNMVGYMFKFISNYAQIRYICDKEYKEIF